MTRLDRSFVLIILTVIISLFFSEYQNNTESIERTCIISNQLCKDGPDNRCFITKKCDSDKCNHANTISINTVTLTWLILSWTCVTKFVLTIF
ncbi:hypothetical protein PUN28_001221 [Cardiocondyla obscurior]|uniref:Late nodulin n=1 Tax=Cardiocondyla obscurior TaxID=286306 RepID=A0AAW2H3Y0_9HYME